MLDRKKTWLIARSVDKAKQPFCRKISDLVRKSQFFASPMKYPIYTTAYNWDFLTSFETSYSIFAIS